MPEIWKRFDVDVDEGGGYAYTQTERFSSRWSNERITRATVEIVRLEGLRVVDVGCGDGTYTAELARRARPALIVGLDPAANAIDIARERHSRNFDNLQFVAGFSSDLVDRGDRFDVAIYRGVIHHVDDPGAEIARAFAIAERVVFVEPNGLNPGLKLLEKISPYHRRHEERSYTPLRLGRWIFDAGGVVERTTVIGFVPFFAPDWFAKCAAFGEPLLERVPLARAVLCAQVCILASRRGEPSRGAR